MRNRITITFDNAMMKEIDRLSEQKKCNKTECIRHLVNVGIENYKDQHLSPKERKIFQMLLEIQYVSKGHFLGFNSNDREKNNLYLEDWEKKSEEQIDDIFHKKN